MSVGEGNISIPELPCAETGPCPSSPHTPGPWVAYDRGIGWEILRPDGETVNGGHRDLFSAADARLIAAAPEVTGSGRELRDSLRQDLQRPDKTITLGTLARLEAFEAALAKAEAV